MLRVHFIHGLEGNPQGSKARFLAEHFDARTPAMDTSDFARAAQSQAEAIASWNPDVVVGSSFGGAIAVHLLGERRWAGPTVLLAPAALKLGVKNELPVGVAVTIAHGLHDDVVPFEDSVALAATGDSELVRLVRVDDGHRLQTLIETGRLADLVGETHSAHVKANRRA